MSSTNFVSYANATTLMQGIADKLAVLEGAYVYRGSLTFANLPGTLTSSMVGYVYNITDDFTTDERFIEGAGKEYAAGSNVAIADVSSSSYNAVTPEGTENPSEEGWYELDGTDYVLSEDTTVDGSKTYYEYVTTTSYMFDVLGNFVDVDALEDEIQAVADMIADEFSASNAYAVGDVVNYNGALYQFTSAHTAGNAWDATEVTQVTVSDLLDGLTDDLNDRIDATQEDIAAAFDEEVAYAVGDLCIYNDQLYKFTSAHAAGAWSASDVTAVTVDALIDAVADKVDDIQDSIADTFDSTLAYSTGDIVYYNNALYVFTSDHTTGDDWDASEVTATTVEELITNAEPSSLTTAQVNALLALLD